jgi:hypothetical protein
MSYFINKIKEARQYFTNTLDKITNKSKEKIILEEPVDDSKNDIDEEGEKKMKQNTDIESTIISTVELDKKDTDELESSVRDRLETSARDELEKKTTAELETPTDDSENISIPYITDEDEDEYEDNDSIYDDNPYIFNHLYTNEQLRFHYINDRLAKTFSAACMDTESTQYKVHFCIFAMNGTCSFKGHVMPFLQFIVEPNNGTHKFITMDFQCSQKEEEEDIYFKNECIKLLLEKFTIPQIDEETLDKIYKGFLEFDNNNIFVVFDFTSLIESISLSKNTDTNNIFNLSLFASSSKPDFKWAIMYDIWNKQINDVPIDDIVLRFFKKYRYMNEIRTDYEGITFTPIPCYLGKYENNEFVNVPGGEMALRSNHPTFGPFYYFSRESTLPNSARYAVFTENNTFLDDLLERFDEEYFSDILTKSVIEYSENKKQLLCVKPESFFYPL